MGEQMMTNEKMVEETKEILEGLFMDYGIKMEPEEETLEFAKRLLWRMLKLVARSAE